LEIKEPLWIPPNDGNDYYAENVTPNITIEKKLMLKEPSNEKLISNFMRNIYSKILTLGNVTNTQTNKGQVLLAI